MAWDNDSNIVSLPASTGLRQYRLVTVGASGVQYPSGSTLGQPIVGVIVSEGTTGSTSDSQTVAVQVAGVAKVEMAASTLATGGWISASSVGQGQPSTNAGDALVGKIVDGSSGAANRIVSVFLCNLGSSVAPAV